MKFSSFCSALAILAAALQFAGTTGYAADTAWAGIHQEVVVSGYVIPGTLSAAERSWYKTFQEGNLLSDGWQKISADILAKTPEQQRAAQKAALDDLGLKIGMEWCRRNSERKVNTDMLREWGDLLRKTASNNPQSLPQTIALIHQKVDAATAAR